MKKDKFKKNTFAVEIFQSSHKQGTFRKPIFAKMSAKWILQGPVRLPNKEEIQAMQSRNAVPKKSPTPNKNKEIKAEKGYVFICVYIYI